MPRIVGVATAVPPHEYSQSSIKAFARKIFGDEERLRRLMPVFENACVEKRYFAKEIEWYARKPNFTETNDAFIDVGLRLSEEVVTKLADQCEIKTTEFDVIFFISTTGVSTPSLDARLFNRVRLNPHIKRIPIFGLGCAGGAAGLARAHDYLMAYPTHRALIVTVELCSLAFHHNDTSKSGIISVALFGDGAAACLMVGDQVPLPADDRARPSTMGSLSTIYPDTEEVMGWKISADGFQVQLSKNIPSIVTSLVKENVAELLSRHEVPLKDVTHFIMHPGGMKVLEAYTAGLEIQPERLKHSVDVLREYGNMSSATVYFVLKRFLESTKTKSNKYGLLASLGPGFGSELLLLKWN